jgi:hypothetical protein
LSGIPTPWKSPLLTQRSLDVAFQEGLNSLQPGHKHLINIGSVGQPRDGDIRAKYVIWDSVQDTLDIRCVPRRSGSGGQDHRGRPAELHAQRLLG